MKENISIAETMREFKEKYKTHVPQNRDEELEKLLSERYNDPDEEIENDENFKL